MPPLFDIAGDRIFYYEWSRKSYVFRLEFIPGSTQQLSSSFQYVPLPQNFLLNCNVKNNYEDGIPIGLPQADTMEIEINLSAIQQNDVKILILRGESSNSIVINGRSLRIPNFWKLLFKEKTEQNWKCVFAGFQDRKPERKYKIEKTYGKININLTITGAHRVLLERIPLSQLKSNNIITSNLYLFDREKWNSSYSMLYEYYYIDENNNISAVANAIQYNPQFKFPYNANQKIHFVSLKDIFVNLRQKISNLFYHFSRSAGTVNIFEDNVFSHLTFFNTNYNDPKLPKNDIIENVYIIQTVQLFDGTIIGGLLENIKDSWVDKYANCWDWLKDLSENLGVKIQFNYIHQFPDYPDVLRFNFKPILDIVNSKIIINQEIKGPIEIIYGKNYITNTIFHIENTKELDFQKGNTLWVYSIINWLTENWENWTNSDKSFEFKVLLSNHTIGLSEKDACDPGIYCKHSLSMNELWTFQTIKIPNGSTINTAFKVNDQVKINLGDGIVVEILSDSLQPIPRDFQDLGKYEIDVWTWMLDRGIKLSLPFLVAYGYEKALFYYPNASEVEIELDYNLVPNYNLGEMALLYFSQITTEDLKLSDYTIFPNQANCIITGIESDLNKFTSKVKLFIRGY